ncbi:MAG: LPS assembly lipoprotein LptE [Longimicrobiales bacterium]|nr:LPS assembly lipoprotein LptE [Longimicrobiales bacterium]
MKKSSRIHRRSGPRVAETLGLLALAAGLSGCMYGFEGGGFPPHIRTIYIAPFENQTAQFDVDQQLFTALIEELPAQLGLQPAGRENADAILTGSIRRYEDVAQNYGTGSQGGSGVLTHEVQIAISAQLVDVRDNVIRWEAGSLVGRGTYEPARETDDAGQQGAIASIIEQIIDGAQSQW